GVQTCALPILITKRMEKKMSNPSLYDLTKRKRASKLLRSAFVMQGDTPMGINQVCVEAYDEFYTDVAYTPSGFERVYDTIIAEVKRQFDNLDRNNSGEVYVTFYSSPHPHVVETLVVATDQGPMTVFEIDRKR